MQITRHDCVEGWSAIGEWTGPQLSALLDAAKVRQEANFILFRPGSTGGDAVWQGLVDRGVLVRTRVSDIDRDLVRWRN